MIPYFPPPVFKLRALVIHPFGILIAIGILIGVQLVVVRGRQLGQSSRGSLSMAAWAIAAGFLGAHLFQGLAYRPEMIFFQPLRTALLRLLIPQLGISSFGGFLGGFFAIYLWSQHHRASLRTQLDAAAFGLPAGWFFGRLGCFLAHDHPGLPTHFFLGVDYGFGAHGGVRHDLGLYEAIAALGIASCCLILGRVRRRSGLYFALVASLYGPLRFLLDFLRVEDVRYAGLTPAQFGAIAVTVLGGVAWVQLAQRERSNS